MKITIVILCSGLVLGLSIFKSDNRSQEDISAILKVQSIQEESTPDENYKKYCALCHGDDREGYKNDEAPSLRTKSLFAAGPIVPYMSTAYGRPGTPMGPYIDDLGGPMTEGEIQELAGWLNSKAGAEMISPRQVDMRLVEGDIELGAKTYAQKCARCHGKDGEGGRGTALGNVTMLATTPDSFLKAAIVRGRSETEMLSYSDSLSSKEIDDVVAFLRSRAQGWDSDALTYDSPPELDNIILNPEGIDPKFQLKEDRYVSAADLNAAIENGRRMVLIDTRVPYFWAMAHIRGSLPMPYYSSREEIIEALPKDDVWIVAYCECPRAAANSTVDRLRELGFKNTAVLYEGYAGWAAQGFPIAVGKVEG